MDILLSKKEFKKLLQESKELQELFKDFILNKNMHWIFLDTFDYRIKTFNTRPDKQKIRKNYGVYQHYSDEAIEFLRKRFFNK